MTSRCSHCNSDGHSEESCETRRTGTGGGGGVMLFGVRLTDEHSIVKKSKSMEKLSLSTAATADSDEEYHSDGPDRGSATRRRLTGRKKAIPWTEEEHRQFLLGLQMLGKGDWLGISKNYVPSKTPSQVASHAQKYYIHQSNPVRKKRRLSVFDMVTDVEINSSTPELSSITSPAAGANGKKVILSSSQEVYTVSSLDSLELSLKPPFEALPFELRPPNAYGFKGSGAGPSHQQTLRPVPAFPEEPINKMLGICQLTLGVTSTVQIEPSALSLSPPGMPMV